MTASLKSIEPYLQRLGYERAPPPTLDTLRALQLRHTTAFPFETLAMLLREPVRLDLPSLERKLLHESRGGYCYELNLLFLALLRRLGFDARGVTGRVVMGGPVDAQTARTHLAILITLDDVRWLVDVGFGGMVPTAPLRLEAGVEQSTPHEPYRLDRRGEGWVLLARVADEWRAMYVFDLQRQSPIDYEVGNWYVSTHPDSPFRDQLIAARTGPGLRLTLNNERFTEHRIGQPSRRHMLESVEAVVGVLERQFGIRVPAHPQLHAAIARQIGREPAAA